MELHRVRSHSEVISDFRRSILRADFLPFLPDDCFRRFIFFFFCVAPPEAGNRDSVHRTDEPGKYECSMLQRIQLVCSEDPWMCLIARSRKRISVLRRRSDLCGGSVIVFDDSPESGHNADRLAKARYCCGCVLPNPVMYKL